MYQKSEFFIDIARVTWRGILFRGLYYSCSTAISQGWFEKARIYGTWRVVIQFSPENLEIIFLIRQDQVESEKCNRIIRQHMCPTKLDKYFDSIQRLKRERSKVKYKDDIDKAGDRC